MIFGILTLLTALTIAGVAAWFSIEGLMAIFSASAIPIAIMAGTLEVGKLVSASWLYRYWNDTKFLMKTYMTTAVVVLMLITSMGIFGYLSKAHLDQAAEGGNNNLQIARISQQIQREEKAITDAEVVIGQLDQAVQTLMDYDRIRGDTGAIATRRNQAEERAELKEIIDTATANIASLQDELLPLQEKQLQVELKVGPLKYVAELIYGEAAESDLDKAVRLFILLLVFVFDPLAVVMVIAANQTLLRYGVNLEGAGPEPPTDKDPHDKQPPIPQSPTATTEPEENSEISSDELEELREQNRSLQANLVAERSRPPRTVEKEVIVEDDSKIQELAAEVEKLLAENDALRNQEFTLDTPDAIKQLEQKLAERFNNGK
jgi:hypothetical protein